MVYTPIPFGTTNWHVPVNDAFTDQDARLTVAETELAATPPIGEVVAADHNAIAWTGDPGMVVSVGALTFGTLYMIRLQIRETQTLTSVAYNVSAAGSGLTAGQNFVGLYNAAGTLLRSTADQTANFGATGFYQVNWSTPVVVPAGAHYVTWLTNGATTPPSLTRVGSWTSGPNPLNVGLTATTARSATSGAGLTALPASVTMSGRTLNATNWWAVLL